MYPPLMSYQIEQKLVGVSIGDIVYLHFYYVHGFITKM